ncbi:S-adenosyl-L-methionine-dependent methyltransferase [Spinellus fusiger]|nr:S-adenosyl-L-methionine-dependent methyltransferase [Spinellus fusiger]KAI7865633.1 S-adenosyl-L-methionine-dependent methyltransferase [Spinellus fusiger]
MSVGSTLPKLPGVRELIKIYGLSAKSQLSQNFILDKNITDKIVRTACLCPDTPLVVEVGPGPGLLTRSILDAGVTKVVAVEKDDRFMPTLKQLEEASAYRFKVIQGNMLKVSHQDIVSAISLSSATESIRGPSHIMGNLPFNVASPLLIQWLHMMAKKEGLFHTEESVWMTLMFQKEVGERLCAQPSTSHRGRLSVMAQSLCHVKTVYQVPSTVFVPKPKVDASVVQLVPKPISPDTPEGDIYPVLETTVRHFFTKRRKTVGHILRHLSKQVPALPPLMDELETIVDFKARPEDIPTESFCQVAKLFHKHTLSL